MPEPVFLQTKLLIPPIRSDALSRERLKERLKLSASVKLVLLSAPAGFGKSTLLSAWVAQCERPVGWLSLDEDDNDPTRFLIYMIAALQQIEPVIGRAVPSLLEVAQPPARQPCVEPSSAGCPALP